MLTWLAEPVAKKIGALAKNYLTFFGEGGLLAACESSFSLNFCTICIEYIFIFGVEIQDITKLFLKSQTELRLSYSGVKINWDTSQNLTNLWKIKFSFPFCENNVFNSSKN